MVAVLLEARGARGIGARGLRAALSASVSLLSDVEQNTESAKIGVLAPVVLADEVTGRARSESTGKAGELSEVAATLDFRMNGGRTLLLFLGLRSLVNTGGGGGDCTAGNENALRSRGRGWDDEGDPTSEAGGSDARGVIDGRLTWCALAGEIDFAFTATARGEARMGGTGEVRGMGVVDEVEGWVSASRQVSEQYGLRGSRWVWVSAARECSRVK
jgi:hypothetical protein